ncbi:MAG: hypothetical protein FWC41_05575 [Firmicutes bacterium]|nr:hypothetical protein [Bacillota bacterium]
MKNNDKIPNTPTFVDKILADVVTVEAASPIADPIIGTSPTANLISFVIAVSTELVTSLCKENINDIRKLANISIHFMIEYKISKSLLKLTFEEIEATIHILAILFAMGTMFFDKFIII